MTAQFAADFLFDPGTDAVAAGLLVRLRIDQKAVVIFGLGVGFGRARAAAAAKEFLE